jgi:L-ascorbate metabolism protein UlaG (beta-lactamase superfamily)
MPDNSPIAFDPIADADLSSGEVTFIGTATVLLRYAGFTILTDPNFLHRGEHAKLGYGLRSKRLTDPALDIEQLPPLDLVVLSHHHGDHFDDVAAAKLEKGLPIVTNPASARKLRTQGFRRPLPLQTWQSQAFTRGKTELRITSMPGKHAPEPLGTLLPDVMGSLLDFSADGEHLLRLYISGDTLMHDRLHEIPRRFTDIDLALIHLGGTRVAGILLTMDAQQGIEMLRLTKPRAAIPIHYDDYTVFKSPLSDFQKAVDGADLPTSVHYLARGESYTFTTTGRA